MATGWRRDERSTRHGPTWCLFGAAPDTDNLGVTALHHATVTGLLHQCPDAQLVVFDNGFGHGPTVLDAGNGRALHHHRAGARDSRRIWRPESFAHLRASTLVGGVGNQGARTLLAADAVLDLSGGDSFSDLYGSARFDAVIAPKTLALARHRPLVLLPQTYGPFREPRHERAARAVLRGATQAWARDPDSFERLRELLGLDFDAARHRCGVDVAFALETREPELVPDPLRGILEQRSEPIAGVNVSGLLLNDSEAVRRFGLQIDPREVAERLLAELAATGARVVLVPHVIGTSVESDTSACGALLAALPKAYRGQVVLAPEWRDPRLVKWLIAQFDWFVGSRMHSTIAGLSSAVPTAAVAYSLKTRGVFATCGQADQVIDGRSTPTDEAVARLLDSFTARDMTSARLRAEVPAVLRRTADPLAAVPGAA